MIREVLERKNCRTFGRVILYIAALIDPSTAYEYTVLMKRFYTRYSAIEYDMTRNVRPGLSRQE